MNTLFKTVLILTCSIFLISCSGDDDTSSDNDQDQDQETSNNFPLKLALAEQIDTITFYKNGEETIPSQNEILFFMKTMKMH